MSPYILTLDVAGAPTLKIGHASPRRLQKKIYELYPARVLGPSAIAGPYVAAAGFYQPSRKPPSNQSHRK